jgi:signal transduction histidine kinase
MGIVNMRTRAEQLPGGRFELGPRSDGGTSVSVSWRAA